MQSIEYVKNDDPQLAGYYIVQRDKPDGPAYDAVGPYAGPQEAIDIMLKTHEPEQVKSYVYILSTYEECGAIDVHAFLDRRVLPEAMNKLLDKYGYRPAARPAIQNGLALALGSKGDADFGREGHDLTRGWGGWQLHVIPLGEI